MQFLIQGAMGVVPAHLSELSPNSVRGFLVGFGYQCGVLLSSCVVYFGAILATHISYAWAMAGTAFISLLLAILATAAGPERRGAAFRASRSRVGTLFHAIEGICKRTFRIA